MSLIKRKYFFMILFLFKCLGIASSFGQENNQREIVYLKEKLNSLQKVIELEINNYINSNEKNKLKYTKDPVAVQHYVEGQVLEKSCLIQNDTNVLYNKKLQKHYTDRILPLFQKIYFSRIENKTSFAEKKIQEQLANIQENLKNNRKYKDDYKQKYNELVRESELLNLRQIVSEWNNRDDNLIEYFAKNGLYNGFTKRCYNILEFHNKWIFPRIMQTVHAADYKTNYEFYYNSCVSNKNDIWRQKANVILLTQYTESLLLKLHRYYNNFEVQFTKSMFEDYQQKEEDLNKEYNKVQASLTKLDVGISLNKVELEQDIIRKIRVENKTFLNLLSLSGDHKILDYSKKFAQYTERFFEKYEEFLKEEKDLDAHFYYKSFVDLYDSLMTIPSLFEELQKNSIEEHDNCLKHVEIYKQINRQALKRHLLLDEEFVQ